MTLLIYSEYTKRHYSQFFNINDLHQQGLINDPIIGLSTDFFIVLRIGIDKVIYGKSARENVFFNLVSATLRYYNIKESVVLKLR